MPFFRFPGDPVWNDERQAVEFEVEVGEYRGLAIVSRRVIHGLIGNRPTPEQCVEYLHLNRMEFERIVEAKIMARALGEDANVHIDGRDVRRNPG